MKIHNNYGYKSMDVIAYYYIYVFCRLKFVNGKLSKKSKFLSTINIVISKVAIQWKYNYFNEYN